MKSVRPQIPLLMQPPKHLEVDAEKGIIGLHSMPSTNTVKYPFVVKM